MPAKSESQRRLFGAALAYKRSKNKKGKKVSKEIKKLSRLSEKQLKDYAKK